MKKIVDLPERLPAVQPVVSIEPLTQARSGLLANLLELYVYDFSAMLGLKPGPDGRFGYKDLDLWWSAPGHYPWLVCVDAEPAGFALVRKGSRISENPEVWDMAEFFVLRGARRRGVGVEAARQVWARFQGRWEVRVMDRNASATAFWARAIAAHASMAGQVSPYAIAGEAWTLFSFEIQGEG